MTTHAAAHQRAARGHRRAAALLLVACLAGAGCGGRPIHASGADAGPDAAAADAAPGADAGDAGRDALAADDACATGFATTFTCTSAGGATCPTGHTCPTLPLGTGGCEDLPALFGQPSTPVDAGRPIGCEVGLPFGNPYYACTQQTCTCRQLPAGDAAVTSSWVCPL
jgi:hypothetical protein